VNLAVGLKRRGYDVALVDIDPQGSATRSLGLETATSEFDPWLAALDGASTVGDLVKTCEEGVDVVAASEGLFQADLFLSPRIGREFALKRALAQLGDRYDAAILDTPPYLGLLTVNALCASDWLLVPISCEFLPVYGLRYLLDAVETVKARAGLPIRVLGYVLTMFDRREKISSEVESAVRKSLGDAVFKTVIRISTRLKRAPSSGRSIFLFDPRGRGATDFAALTQEVISRIFSGGKP